MKARLKPKTRPPENLTPSLGFLNPLQLVTELKVIAKEADEKRLSVLIDGFQQEYPELYEFISGLVDETAPEAMSKLKARWPIMQAVLIFIPEWQDLIVRIQNEIKHRRDA